MIRQIVLIGIAGPSGSGKTTYGRHLIEYLRSPLDLIQLDHFFHRKRTINHPILGQIQTAEGPDSLHAENLLNLLRGIKQQPDKLTPYHRSAVSVVSKRPVYVVVEGFLLFALSAELTSLFDIRIFFDSRMSHCQVKRYRRRARIDEGVPDAQVAVPEEFQRWFEHLVWDEYLKRRDLQISKADKVFHSDTFQNQQYAQLDTYVDQRAKEIAEQRT